MQKWAKQKGFTIVELLIVIVVIAILAAITIVAYNGIQARAKFTRAQSDLVNTQKLVELYKIQYGAYPISTVTGAWSFQSAGTQNTYILGLVPEFANNLPIVSDSSGQYIYRTNTTGTEYKIVKFKSGGLPSDEWGMVPASMKDGSIANADRYGYWSSGGYSL